MVLPDSNARVVFSRSVVFDEGVIVQRILGLFARGNTGSEKSVVTRRRILWYVQSMVRLFDD